MSRIVGIRLEGSVNVNYFDPGNLELSLLDTVMVQTETGVKQGMVVVSPDQVIYSEIRGPLQTIMAKTSDLEG